VEMLKGEPLEEEKVIVTKRHTENKDAHNLYLKGLYFWNSVFPGFLPMSRWLTWPRH
jgi:hypothetical protein